MTGSRSAGHSDGRVESGLGIVGIDHVQLAMPAGGERAASAFYGELLGFSEVAKPAALAARGGCWFVAQGTHLHLGVEEDFTPARKAHVALVVPRVGDARGRLEAAGVRTVDDPAEIGVDRFYADDPFGNRLEFVAQADRGFTAHDANGGSD